MDEIKSLLATIAGIFASIVAVFSGLAVAFKPAREWLMRKRTANSEIENIRPSQKKIITRQVINIDELEQIFLFDAESYGPDNRVTFEQVKEWWLAYPEGIWAAFQGTQPVGVFGMFPVTDSWSQNLVAGVVEEHDLTKEIIEKSERTHWYFSGLSLKDPRRGLSRVLARLICHGLSRWSAHEFNADENRTINVVAIGSTEEGRGLLGKFNFEIVATGQKDRHPVFRRRLDQKKLSSFLMESRFCSNCKNEYSEI
jgi:hypothetical protein